MAKPDPSLLSPERYPFRCAMPTRFGDLDTNMHVNNAALVTILEDARVRFHAACGFIVAKTDWSAMVASATVDYLAQIHYPAPLEVYGAIAHLGRTSYRLNQLVCQDGVPAALGQTVLVCVREGKPAPLPQPFALDASAWMMRP